MKTKKRSGDTAGDVDARVLRSKKAVLTATFQLLAEAGLSGVSVDEVSKRSGVAKTTVYRHWPSRSALLLDACSNLGAKPEVPDTGHFKTDLLALTAFVTVKLRTDRMATILPSIIDAGERDPELAELHTRLHEAFMAPFYTVIERAKKKGEVARDAEPSEIVASLVGPLFYRRWFSRQPLDERFIKNVVERVIG